jgi:hypothetical protein
MLYISALTTMMPRSPSPANLAASLVTPLESSFPEKQPITPLESALPKTEDLKGDFCFNTEMEV